MSRHVARIAAAAFRTVPARAATTYRCRAGRPRRPRLRWNRRSARSHGDATSRRSRGAPRRKLARRNANARRSWSDARSDRRVRAADRASIRHTAGVRSSRMSSSPAVHAPAKQRTAQQTSVDEEHLHAPIAAIVPRRADVSAHPAPRAYAQRRLRAESAPRRPRDRRPSPSVRADRRSQGITQTSLPSWRKRNLTLRIRQRKRREPTRDARELGACAF